MLLYFFFHENYFYFFMFRDVPACSGMFRVPGFIDAQDFAISFPRNQIFCLASMYEISSILCSLLVNFFSNTVITVVYINIS